MYTWSTWEHKSELDKTVCTTKGIGFVAYPLLLFRAPTKAGAVVQAGLSGDKIASPTGESECV
jgi:hypothetical protein